MAECGRGGVGADDAHAHIPLTPYLDAAEWIASHAAERSAPAPQPDSSLWETSLSAQRCVRRSVRGSIAAARHGPCGSMQHTAQAWAAELRALSSLPNTFSEPPIAAETERARSISESLPEFEGAVRAFAVMCRVAVSHARPSAIMQFGGGPVFVVGADASRAQRDGSGLWLQRVEAPEDVAVSELPFAPHDLGSHACVEPAPADWLARAVVSLTARLELLDTRFGVAAGLRASVEDAIAKSMPSLLRGPPHVMTECMRFLHEADAASGA